jgi:hypothetical protein
MFFKFHSRFLRKKGLQSQLFKKTAENVHSNSIFRFYTTETFRKLIFYKTSMKFIEFR